jgi:hypothetical protein
MPINFAPYRKTIAAVVGAGVAFATLVVVSASGPITDAEWLSGAVGLLTALGVYGVTNDPS